MVLNHIALAFITLIPFVVAHFWYNPNFALAKWANYAPQNAPKLSIAKLPIAYIFAYGLMFTYVNLIIHQLGFYELFFTDIMRGSEEARQVAEAFLAEYGQKHRHLGHGFFHGIIVACSMCLPFISFFAFLENKTYKWVMYHFLYWLLVSTVCGALIAEFV